MRILDTTQPRFWSQLEAFCAAAQADPALVRRVAAIIAGVRRSGDAAVRRYTRKFDGVDVPPSALRVPVTEILDAAQRLTRAERAAFTEAVRCVRAFHLRTLPRNWRARNPHGAIVGENFYPLRRVGINVPGGQVPLVSTVIMTCVLAQLAGVREIAVCTPPDKQGGTNRGLLAALSFCGVNEVYRMGGVQAMAAFAFGTASIPAVDKLCGPGNAYTIEAKRQLYGLAGVDLLPGPSEVLVLADATANPRWLALDLLAQAEHGTGKERLFFISTNRSVLNQTLKEVARLAPQFSAGNHLADVLKKGFLAILAENLDEAAAVANFLAPEHLELHVRRSALDVLALKITTAGAILQGSHTPTVLGDFTAGPSHTLPTGRTGRFFSGLRLTDFLRRSSIVRYEPKSLQRAANVVAAFSTLESLPAHGQSLRARLGQH